MFNVLRGDMSLVGPRPEVAKYCALWDPKDETLIHSVQPGLTDPASLQFRRESELLAAADDPEDYYINVILPRKVALYIDYVRNRSLVGDAVLVFRTLLSVLSR